ncbi:MAG TPA: hypothetical protein VFW66_06990 [Gemmatimonadales bacterium]|nr:hypothetical protein [Gemmatimonadales bacterium]
MLLLLPLVLLLPRAADAQYSPVHRGSIQLAGTAQLSHFRDIGNDFSSSVIELAPRLGYFVAPGLALNANLQFRHDASEVAAATQWGVGPGLTYYVSGLSRRVYPFVSGRTLFTWSHAWDGSGVVLDRRNSTSWLVSSGALVLLAEHVGLTAELYYQHDRFTVEPSTNSDEQYGLQWGFAIFVH